MKEIYKFEVGKYYFDYKEDKIIKITGRSEVGAITVVTYQISEPKVKATTYIFVSKESFSDIIRKTRSENEFIEIKLTKDITWMDGHEEVADIYIKNYAICAKDEVNKEELMFTIQEV